MGGAVSADCKCGYKGGSFSGTGLRSAAKAFWFNPALCPVCKKVVAVNLMAPEIVCSDGCTGTPKPYIYTPELQTTPGDRVVTEWDGWKLNNGKYLCPSCAEFSLEFYDSGICWD